VISLKMTPAEAKAEGYGAPVDVKPPAYPWGTRITLTDEVAKEMFPDGLPKVGTAIAIDAFATVASCNMTQQEGGETRLSIELQITDIDIEQDVEEKPTPAQTIYGKE
jgi:hypothetical protein